MNNAAGEGADKLVGRRTIFNASALSLFIYAGFFSLAYLYLETGMGALILFSSVQATMMGWGLYKGERPSFMGWLGIGGALLGLIYLLSPGLSAPHPVGAVLMAAAGVGWGVYSLRGRGSQKPILHSAQNFTGAVPWAIIFLGLYAARLDLSAYGIVLALSSGVITSAIGYVIWYKVLPFLRVSEASIMQLSVPVIAALGGIVFAGEPITLRFIGASLAILGGVALNIYSGRKA